MEHPAAVTESFCFSEEFFASTRRLSAATRRRTVVRRGLADCQSNAVIAEKNR
jgi:hypothetical protein